MTALADELPRQQARCRVIVERAIAKCKERMDYEAKAAAHYVGTWHAAYDYHMTRFVAMSDLMDVMRACADLQEYEE